MVFNSFLFLEFIINLCCGFGLWIFFACMFEFLYGNLLLYLGLFNCPRKSTTVNLLIFQLLIHW